jgi:hypothetical protein
MDPQDNIQTEITEIHTQEQQFPLDKLCTECLELNLIEGGVCDTFKTCSTCQELFCIHAVSRLDPQYCIYCCNDFNLSSNEETVTREVRDEEGRVTSSKSFRIRHLGLSGNHWLFYNRAINSMSDIELDCAIEYHYGMRNGMLQEREARRNAYIHRNKDKVAGNENVSLIEGTAANPLINTQDGAVFAMSSSSTTTRRTRTVKTTSSATKDPLAAMQNAIKILMEKGLTQEQIMALMSK